MITKYIYNFCSKRTCAFLLLYLLVQFDVKAQITTEEDVKCAFIYRLVDEIIWTNIDDSKYFTFAFLENDSAIYNTFNKYIVDIQNVKGKPIKLLKFEKTSDIRYAHILYVSNEFCNDLANIRDIAASNTLIISDRCDNYGMFMINLFIESNKIRFEMNSASINFSNLRYTARLLDFGGTEVDLLAELDRMGKDVENYKKEIDNKEMLLKELQQQIENQLKEIEKRNDSIGRQNENINSQNARLWLQQNSLIDLINKAKIQKDNLTKKENILDEKQLLIEDKEYTIERQERLIQKHAQTLKEQEIQVFLKQKELEEKEARLQEMNSQIEHQKLIIYLSAALIFAVLIMLFFIYRSNQIRRIANKKLLEKNKAINKQKLEIQEQAKELTYKNYELEKLSIVARETDNAILLINPQGIIEWVNEGFTRLYNFTLEELEHERGLSLVEQSLYSEIDEILKSCVENKQTQIYETCTLSRYGKEIWAQTTITPILNEKGEVIKLIAIDSDISRLKNAEIEIQQQSEELAAYAEELYKANTEIEKEKEKAEKALHDLKTTQSQLIQSEKMASLGQLTAGIAHEINNPVNFIAAGINSLIQILDDLKIILASYEQIKEHNFNEKLKEIEALKQELDYPELIQGTNELPKTIKSGADRTTEIVKGLRTFSRLDEDTLKKADINENLDSTIVMTKNIMKNKIEIQKKYAKLPLIECYPGKLNQVFLNILVNATQAIKTKGIITISTFLHSCNDKEYVGISIKDNGCGIKEEIKARIFEPFFTSKNVGEGTGLGLSISLGIVEKHKGFIEVNSQENIGSEFIIYIPTRYN